MEAQKVAQIAELEGVEASIGTSKLSIGHAAKDFIAGAVSGMVGIASGQPLDTLRVRLQQRGCQQTSVAGIWKDMAGREGVRGLFRGMSYPIYTTALQNAVTFQAQGAASRLLNGTVDKAPVSWQHTCLAGMFAGAVQTTISCPVELLKIRLQLQQALPGSSGYVGPWGMLQRVVTQEGVLGLFRGFTVTLARDTPSYGLYFCTYHWMVQGLSHALQQLQSAASLADQQPQLQLQPLAAVAAQQQLQQQSYVSEPLVQFVAGGVAGALAWASVYPLDVVKSRMQSLPRHSSPYSGVWQCASSSLREEGRSVFVKGLGATMARGFIVNAAIFASFEALMKAMADT